MHYIVLCIIFEYLRCLACYHEVSQLPIVVNITFHSHLLCSFLDGVSADYDDLQLHCGVYGLNKEKVLKRLWALKKEIQPFLQEHRAEQTKHFWNFLAATNRWWFPTDILTYFIPSTKVFRAWIKISDIQQAIFSLQEKFDALWQDLGRQGMSYFQSLESTRHRSSWYLDLGFNGGISELMHISDVPLLCTWALHDICLVLAATGKTDQGRT